MPDVNGQEGTGKDEQLPRPHARVQMRPPLTPAEQQLVWKASTTLLAASERLALALMLEMGLRPREVCVLTYQAIAPDALSVRGKEGKIRMVPLGEETRQALGRYLMAYPPSRESDEVLLRLDVASLPEMVRALGRDVGLGRPLSVHDLRRAAIRRARATHGKGDDE
jgi:integrase